MNDRLITFGKYKRKPIKLLILTHIGYIMWCLKNINWFKLNEEEQIIYDAVAIMSKKYDVSYVFSSEELYSYIKDKDKLSALDTPFVFNNGYISINEENKNSKIFKSIEKYLNKGTSNKKYNGLYDLRGLQHSFEKEINTAIYNGFEIDEIFPTMDDLMDW